MLRTAGIKLEVKGMAVSAWWRRRRCFAVKTGGTGDSWRDEEGEPAKNSLKEGNVSEAGSSTMGNPRWL
jgi:hypothetical protein